MKICVLAAVVVLVGCASRMPPASSLNKISLGMNEQNVKDILGEPYKKTVRVNSPTCLEYQFYYLSIGSKDFNRGHVVLLQDDKVIETKTGEC